jgi:putative transposase
VAEKKGALTLDQKRALIDPEDPISIRQQCAWLGLARSRWYFEPQGEREENRELMRVLDEQYLHTPFYGVRRMTAWLIRQGYEVNEKRIRRLLRLMGIEAIYPKPRLSLPGASDTRYPYLLRDLAIERVNQVWSTDITYVPMPHGFLYLVAVMDWHSRYVLSWELSNTLDTSFCVSALERALAQAHPEIFKGAQFTSQAYIGCLQTAQVRISWDGRGRALDNVFVERLWRTVKYEEIYLHDYQSVAEAARHLTQFFQCYNSERLHQCLQYHTPAEIYLAQ